MYYEILITGFCIILAMVGVYSYYKNNGNKIYNALEIERIKSIKAALPDFTVEHPLLKDLTPKEIEVLNYVITGLEDQEIAQLGEKPVSKRAVSRVVGFILEKTNSRNRTHLAYRLLWSDKMKNKKKVA